MVLPRTPYFRNGYEKEQLAKADPVFRQAINSLTRDKLDPAIRSEANASCRIAVRIGALDSVPTRGRAAGWNAGPLRVPLIAGTLSVGTTSREQSTIQSVTASNTTAVGDGHTTARSTEPGLDIVPTW